MLGTRTTTTAAASAPTPVDVDRLPPTQGLILEVLAGRLRTGERLWPFDSRLSRQMDALAALGLVNHLSGNVEKTVRASLTSAGEKVAFGSTYVSPIEQDLAAARTEIKVLRQAIERGSGS